MNLRIIGQYDDVYERSKISDSKIMLITASTTDV